MSAALQIDGLARIYGRTPALRTVRLALGAGDTLALLGPNGSGKTTLLKILAGAVTPTLGDATIFGLSLRRDRVALRRTAGLMASETYLYDDLTAAENLRFAATMAGVRLGDDAIGALLAGVGLEGSANDRVRTFSSGMQRRLSLARTLALEPRLLLLDEPYNSLDESAAALVDDAVARTVERGGIAILATHDTGRALAIATRVARLDRGAVTFDGTPAEYAARAVHVG